MTGGKMGADEIVFDAALLGGGPLTLTQGQLSILGDVTIDGDLDTKGNAGLSLGAFLSTGQIMAKANINP